MPGESLYKSIPGGPAIFTLSSNAHPQIKTHLRSASDIETAWYERVHTQGPWWGYFKSQFQLDLFTFNDISTQKRTNGSKNEHGIPPRRTFCGFSYALPSPNHWCGGVKNQARLHPKHFSTLNIVLNSGFCFEVDSGTGRDHHHHH